MKSAFCASNVGKFASRKAFIKKPSSGDTRALLLHGKKVVPLSEDHVPKRCGSGGDHSGETILTIY